MDRREFVKTGAVTLALLSAHQKGRTQPLKLPGIHAGARVSRYENATVQATSGIDLDLARNQSHEIRLESTKWHCSWKLSSVANRPDALDLSVSFQLTSGTISNCAAAVEFEFDNWSTANYVCLPAAAYNGNRFRVTAEKYPPFFEKSDWRTDLPIAINDFPHLSLQPGYSALDTFTGDLSTPAAGIYSPAAGSAFWVLTEQQTRLGNSGVAVEESSDRSKATVRITAPQVRHQLYRFGRMVPGTDRGATWNAGDEVTLRMRLFRFGASNLQPLFDRYFEIRKDLAGPTTPREMIPMSQVFSIIEEKQNRENWSEKWGFYTEGWQHPGDSIYSMWQLGWCGGLQNTLALLLAGNEVSRQRAWKNIDTILTRSQAASGFFYCIGDGEKWYGDDYRDANAKNIGMVRKNSDALYFVLRQFLLLEEQGHEVPKAWQDALRKQADAFVLLWKKNGQFGQFVDVESGNIIVGATTAGAVAVAGLAMASRYYGNEEYLSVAEESARLFYTRDVRAGVTVGGPGDALQAPDSESSYALLDSFTVLYEITGKEEWLKAAREQTAQFVTWVVTYDYKFPPESTFGRLGMKTTGSVWANGQNRHAAPAICVGSGEALLRLYRATGYAPYLDLLRDIVQNGPQYVSRKDRAIQAMDRGKLVDMRPGWICERVQMSDWETPSTPVGEVFNGSASWCEAAVMLSMTQIPGLYVQPDRGLAWVFDQVEAQVVGHSGETARVRLANRTQFPARVRVLVESSAGARKPLGFTATVACPMVEIAAGESREYVFDGREPLNVKAV